MNGPTKRTQGNEREIDGQTADSVGERMRVSSHQIILKVNVALCRQLAVEHADDFARAAIVLSSVEIVTAASHGCGDGRDCLDLGDRLRGLSVFR